VDLGKRSANIVGAAGVVNAARERYTRTGPALIHANHTHLPRQQQSGQPADVPRSVRTAQAVYQQRQWITLLPAQRRIVMQHQSVAIGQMDEMALVWQGTVQTRHQDAKHSLNVRITKKRQGLKIEVR
jgi:hypothetical protein